MTRQSKQYSEEHNELLLNSLKNFYKSKKNLQALLAILDPKNSISLRLIDWFVTNYSKGSKTVIIFREINEDYINVYASYRLQLKAFSKVLFDPFRRNYKINFEYDHGKTIETTIGQLNFFKWLIENNIREYIEKHKDEINHHMVKFSQSRKKPQRKNSSMSLGSNDIMDSYGNKVGHGNKSPENKNLRQIGCGRLSTKKEYIINNIFRTHEEYQVKFD
jgi:hypothetical protein